jgi:hypothetical protein
MVNKLPDKIQHDEKGKMKARRPLHDEKATENKNLSKN